MVEDSGAAATSRLAKTEAKKSAEFRRRRKRPEAYIAFARYSSYDLAQHGQMRSFCWFLESDTEVSRWLWYSRGASTAASVPYFLPYHRKYVCGREGRRFDLSSDSSVPFPVIPWGWTRRNTQKLRDRPRSRQAVGLRYLGEVSHAPTPGTGPTVLSDATPPWPKSLFVVSSHRIRQGAWRGRESGVDDSPRAQKGRNTCTLSAQGPKARGDSEMGD